MYNIYNMCYMLDMVKMGQIIDIVQILGLQTHISIEFFFEHLTSEGSVTQMFEMSSSLTSFLQNVDINTQN